MGIFRQTFVYQIDNLAGGIYQEMLECLRTKKEFERETEEIGATSMTDIEFYEADLMLETGEATLLAKCLVVVVHGADWVNFMELTLGFNERFPSSRVERESVYEYVLRDENCRFDDLERQIRNPL